MHYWCIRFAADHTLCAWYYYRAHSVEQGSYISPHTYMHKAKAGMLLFKRSRYLVLNHVEKTTNLDPLADDTTTTNHRRSAWRKSHLLQQQAQQARVVT